MKVTQRVLSYGLSESGVDFFELDSIQSQSIDSSYLPASRAPGLINKKADYALVYSPHHPEIAGVYRPLLLDGYTLSQMTDTYTKHLAMASGAEVKPVHGNSLEALAQLATWFASGFTKVRELNIEAGKEEGIDELQPMIGYTVVGHIWDTYTACDLETDGESVVRMVGPLIGLSASTASMHDIFKLLALVESAKVYPLAMAQKNRFGTTLVTIALGWDNRVERSGICGDFSPIPMYVYSLTFYSTVNTHITLGLPKIPLKSTC